MKSVINTSSVDKSFVLLEFLAAAGRSASLQEVAETVKLPKPTAYRLLRALQDLGYVSRPAGSRDYLIGPRTALLAAADPHGDLKAQARPLLRRLHEEFNETINLGVLSGTQVLYLDFVETTQPLRFIVTPGQNDPWYCTALGRAVAMRMDDPALERLMAKTRLKSQTPHTVKSKEQLLRKIAQDRAKNYAEEIEESVQGVSCLALNLGPLGFPEAAISMAIPIQRLTPRRRKTILHSFQSFSES